MVVKILTFKLRLKCIMSSEPINSELSLTFFTFKAAEMFFSHACTVRGASFGLHASKNMRDLALCIVGRFSSGTACKPIYLPAAAVA